MSKLWEDFLKNFSSACEKSNRKKSEIQILPVSKGVSVEKINEHLNLKNFPRQLAENYEAELLMKQKLLTDVEWHYQGALQSRKMASIFSAATFVQSVSRLKELEYLKKNPGKVKGLFLQVNLSEEGQKLGASFDEARALLDNISRLELTDIFCGFMGVASDLSKGISEKDIRAQFCALREFKERVAPGSKLSMGMSADYHLAITEGADIIRIGSLVFGSRKAP